jgi:hypothetical protein
MLLKIYKHLIFPNNQIAELKGLDAERFTRIYIAKNQITELKGLDALMIYEH